MTTKDKMAIPGTTLTWEPLSEEDEKDVYENFLFYKQVKVVKVNPGGWFIGKLYLDFAQSIYNFKFCSDDVLVMTYPKSGTTWMQEILWTMRHNPDLNNPRALEVIDDRCVMIEFDVVIDPLDSFDQNHPEYEKFQRLCPGKNFRDGVFFQMASVEQEKRTLKTHLPLTCYKQDLLNKCKVVYLARNPRDVLQSYYHFCRLIAKFDYVGDFDTFVDLFVRDKIIFGPFWEHVKQGWQNRHHPNFHFVFYEDLKQNTEEEIRKIDAFLDTKLTDQQIKNVINHTSFENMKKMDTTSGRPGLYEGFMHQNVLETEGGFFRKGQIGSWKKEQHLTAEQEIKLSSWIKENERAIGIKFKYE